MNRIEGALDVVHQEYPDRIMEFQVESYLRERLFQELEKNLKD